MAKPQHRVVYCDKARDKWINKKIKFNRASSVHDTRQDAIKAAEQMLRNQGGGQLIVKDHDGVIRSTNAIPSWSESFSPHG